MARCDAATSRPWALIGLCPQRGSHRVVHGGPALMVHRPTAGRMVDRVHRLFSLAWLMCTELTLGCQREGGCLMETGIPIFRQVQDKQRFVRRATHRSGFRSQRPKPCNLSTTSPLVINRVTIRLTSPRRLIPAVNRRTQARTR